MLEMRILFLYSWISACSAFLTPSPSLPQPLLHAASLVEQEAQGAHDLKPSSQFENNSEVVTKNSDDLLSPAEYENGIFDCDPSVSFWQNFQRSGLHDAPENIREIISVTNRFANKGGDALNYWLVRINTSKHISQHFP